MQDSSVLVNFVLAFAMWTVYLLSRHYPLWIIMNCIVRFRHRTQAYTFRSICVVVILLGFSIISRLVPNLSTSVTLEFKGLSIWLSFIFRGSLLRIFRLLIRILTSDKFHFLREHRFGYIFARIILSSIILSSIIFIRRISGLDNSSRDSIIHLKFSKLGGRLYSNMIVSRDLCLLSFHLVCRSYRKTYINSRVHSRLCPSCARSIVSRASPFLPTRLTK